MSTQNPPKALLFDVFGTVVDWRTSITRALVSRSQEALARESTDGHTIPPETREKASSLSDADWGAFAQEWRNSYIAFVREYNQNETSSSPFVTVDEHHLSSLRSLLTAWHLDNLWPEPTLQTLSQAWHFLDAWTDSSAGLEALNANGFITSTLSNGNTALLDDLSRHAHLPFQHLLSAEHFGAYKPSPRAYNGAASKLGLEPGRCALVAAHLGDLAAARACGFQTVYVERRDEEGYTADEVEKARREGWVDMWVEQGEEGFLEVAKRFGARGL